MDITINKLNPAQDPALARKLPMEEASILAIRLTEQDDDGWDYTIERAPCGRYMVFVTDDEGFGLGYL